MYKLNLKDYIYIIVKSFVAICLFCLIAFMFVCMINFNIFFASYICEVTGVPSDLSLTIMSAGIKNNIIK